MKDAQDEKERVLTDKELWAFSRQFDNPDLNVRLWAVGDLAASGDVRALPVLIDVLLRDDDLLHRAVKAALVKLGATGWLQLFHADDAEWRRLVEGKDPVISAAIESRYVQGRIMDVLSHESVSVKEELTAHYFAAVDKDAVEAVQDPRSVDKPMRPAQSDALKTQPKERPRAACGVQPGAHIRGLSDRSASVRLESVRFIATARDSRAVKPLARLLCDPSPAVRAEAAAALVQLGDLAVPGLIGSLHDVDVRVFKKVVELLGSLLKDDALDLLTDVMLSHAGPEFRAVAIHSMRRFAGKQVAVALAQSAAEDPSPENRAAAAKVLRSVNKRPAQGASVLK